MDYFKIGMQSYRNGQYEEARDYFNQALDIDDSNPKIWNSLGIIYSKLGKYNEAEVCYENALIIDPGNETYEKNLKINAKKKIQGSTGGKKVNPIKDQNNQTKRISNYNNLKNLAIFFIMSIFFLGVCLIFSAVLSMIQGTWPSLIKPIISLCFFCWMKTNIVENSIY